MPNANPVQITHNHLHCNIILGAGANLNDLVNYQLIWAREYYLTDSIATVDLMLSSKDLSIGRALSRKKISYDLKPLQVTDSNRICINFIG